MHFYMCKDIIICITIVLTFFVFTGYIDHLMVSQNILRYMALIATVFDFLLGVLTMQFFSKGNTIFNISLFSWIFLKSDIPICNGHLPWQSRWMVCIIIVGFYAICFPFMHIFVLFKLRIGQSRKLALVAKQYFSLFPVSIFSELPARYVLNVIPSSLKYYLFPHLTHLTTCFLKDVSWRNSLPPTKKQFIFIFGSNWFYSFCSRIFHCFLRWFRVLLVITFR